MKCILLLVLCTFLYVSAFSQIENLFKNKSLKQLKLKPESKWDIKNFNPPVSIFSEPKNDLKNGMPVLLFDVQGALKKK